MKRNVFGSRTGLPVLFAVLCLLFCPSGAKGDYRTGVADQVRAAFGQFAELYCKKDVNGIMSLFADEPDIVAIGLREDQVAVGTKAVKNMFEKDLSATEGTVKLPFEVVTVDNLGPAAWLTAKVYPYAVLKDGTTVKGHPGRMTLVLRKMKGKWRFLQVHFSVPSSPVNAVRGDRLAEKKVP